MSDDNLRLITQLLSRAGQGDDDALGDLLAAVYDELHQIARAQMAHEAPGRTLQPTALVHEAYLRLFSGTGGSFENRRHFFAAAAEAMHRIRVDDARRRKRLKRGGGAVKERWEGDPLVFDHDGVDILALDEALSQLGNDRPDLVELVRLRFFVGFSLEETAEAMGISRRTVATRWRLAKAWLFGALGTPAEELKVSEPPNADGSLGID